MEKLLGIKFDSKLNFNSNIHDICQKTRQKLNAIFRIAPYIDFASKRFLINAFFHSQLDYCQLANLPKLFKVFKDLSPVIFAEDFPVRQESQYNLWN